MRYLFLSSLFVLASALPARTQEQAQTQAQKAVPSPNLKQRIADIASESNATVSVACALPGKVPPANVLDCGLNINNHSPMLSVFKLPLAVTVLHLVEQNKLTLDQSVRFLPGDRILPEVYSPLQTQHPDANIDLPLHDLLRLSTTLSDNVAADILLRLAGGPAAVQAYITSLGIQDFRLVDNEQGLHQDAQNQFHNWITPDAAVKLLRLVADQSPLNPANTTLLMDLMVDTTASPIHIKAGVPPGTIVRHKSGLSQTVLNVTYATNDIGLVSLPDGRMVALAIFLTNATDDEKERGETIAKVAKAVYEAAIKP